MYTAGHNNVDLFPGHTQDDVGFASAQYSDALHHNISQVLQPVHGNFHLGASSSRLDPPTLALLYPPPSHPQTHQGSFYSLTDHTHLHPAPGYNQLPFQPNYTQPPPQLHYNPFGPQPYYDLLEPQPSYNELAPQLGYNQPPQPGYNQLLLQPGHTRSTPQPGRSHLPLHPGYGQRSPQPDYNWLHSEPQYSNHFEPHHWGAPIESSPVVAAVNNGATLTNSPSAVPVMEPSYGLIIQDPSGYFNDSYVFSLDLAAAHNNM